MQKPKFKILSLDGGGIRGIIPCTILKFIEEEMGKPISKIFNAIVGTSTGGIIALGLAARKENTNFNKFKAADMLNLYTQNGETIFGKRPSDFWTWVDGISEATSDLNTKPYDATGLKNLLTEKFGETKLSDVLTEVAITTYDIERGKPFYFLSRLAKTMDSENFTLETIARSTSAAPTYFEPSLVKWQEDKDLAFVDGGVFANNPSILAYAEAKEIWKARGHLAFAPPVAGTDDDLPFYMLSLGTGYCGYSISGDKAKEFRSKDWIKPLLTDVFMRGVSENTDTMMRYLLPNYADLSPRYQRFNVSIPEKNAAMDNASPENIKALTLIAEAYVDTERDNLKRVCDLLS